MGCCASTNYKAASAPQKLRQPSDARSDASYQAKAPPPPPPEEETVKEVLSETPVPKPQFSKIEDEKKKRVTWPSLNNVREDDDHKPPLLTVDEASEMSDLCSLNESVSTATATEESEVRQRSPAKFRNRPVTGQRNVVGKSPGRWSQPSPGRFQPRPDREKRGSAADGQRRDSWEISARRSRSPATRTANGRATKPDLIRSPSTRRTGKSPARSRSEPEEIRKPEEPANREDKWPPMPPTVNESLENPLVSLECFIFL